MHIMCIYNYGKSKHSYYKSNNYSQGLYIILGLLKYNPLTR